MNIEQTHRRIRKRIGPRWLKWTEGGMDEPFWPPAPVHDQHLDISMTDIAWVVAQHYGFSRAELLTPRRTDKYARPRFLAMYLVKEYNSKIKSTDIAKYFGFDHTSILHGISKAAELLETDAEFKRAYQSVCAAL